MLVWMSLVGAVNCYPLLRSGPIGDAWEAAPLMEPLIAAIDRYRFEHGVYPESLDGMPSPADVLETFDDLGWSYSQVPEKDEFCLVITTPVQGSSCCVHLLYWSRSRAWRECE